MGTSQVVLTKKISLWKDPEIKNEGLIGTKNEILEILSKVLDKNQHPLLDLELCTDGQGSAGPFVKRILILGRREVILCYLPEIVKRIVAGKEWRKDGIWIGFNHAKKPRIKDLI